MGEVSDQFKTWIRQWVEFDNKEKEIKEDLGEIRDNKKVLTNNIIKYMRSNEVPDIEIPDGFIEVNVSKCKSSFNKPGLVKLLGKSGYLKEGSAAKDLVDFLYENREIKEIARLKRVINN